MRTRRAAKSPCPDLEDLGAILDLPVEDARRRHVQSCRRCQLLLAEHGRFLAASEELPGSRTEEARRSLREAWSRTSTPPRVLPAPSRRFSGTRRGPLRRFAPVLVALAAAFAIAVISRNALRGSEEPPAVRGPRESTRPSSLLVAPRLESASPAGEDAVLLRWSATPGASAYEVRLFDAHGREIARLDAVAGTSRTVTRTDVSAWLTSNEEILGRVVAITAQGDSVASAFFTLRIP